MNFLDINTDCLINHVALETFKINMIRSDQSLDWVVIGKTGWHIERQANLSSIHLVRVGLSSLVHSFWLSTLHFACRWQFLLPCFSVPCSTILVSLLWRVMWPNHTSFLLFTAPIRLYCSVNKLILLVVIT